MSLPITARLGESTVNALDRAVEAGLAETRSGAVMAAVTEWLDRHGEEAVIDSYRRGYSSANPEQEDLIAKIATFSIAARLADD